MDINVTDGTVLETLNNKVDIDGGNYVGSPLEEYVHKHSMVDKITNCITEIPQRIKLELKNGVLTLKAGSKLIIPDGDGIFDEYVYATDKVFTVTPVTDGQYFIFQNDFYLVSMCTSGATDKLANTPWHIWYDTTNNLVKVFRDDGTTFTHTTSLPFGIFTIKNGVITSIDQVFNGFGYIGSTAWVDKGVKGLIPNGRNEDGSVKNIELTTNRIIFETYASIVNTDTYRYLVGEADVASGLISNTSFWSLPTEYIKSPVQPPIKEFTLWYDTKNNLHKRCINSEWHIVKVVKVGSEVVTNGVITSFNPKQPFRAVNYSDSSTVGGWGMPSGKYIDLTLGASGTTYTAPANGYFQLNKRTTGNNQFIYFQDDSNTMLYTLASISYTGGLWCHCQVAKGRKIKVYYSAAGQTDLFRFIYAEGEV